MEDNPQHMNSRTDRSDFPTFIRRMQSDRSEIGQTVDAPHWRWSWSFDSPSEGYADSRQSPPEGANWRNSKVQDQYFAPGPGILAPLLPGAGNVVDHELFAIKVVIPPKLNQHPLSMSYTPRSQSPSNLNSFSVHSPPPLEDELRAAVLHPDAYYSPKHGSWILLSWSKSKRPPPVIPLYPQEDILNAVFRREERGASLDCNDSLDRSRTHHFHKFPSAVDPTRLDPPYKPGDSESFTSPLDLYVCCQCQIHLIASSFSQPVVPQSLWNAFLEERRRLSRPETTVATMITTGLRLLHTAIQNGLWGGEDDVLKTKSLSFRRHDGVFTPVMRQFFEFIGFSVDHFDEFDVLMPASTDMVSQKGLQNRAKMLRIWVELGTFLTHFTTKHGQSAL
ncbi:hypothetical protein DL96DRAFT_1305190 [Flagelloscypha sp. PMI_526]|nr:hypothetical protein DL96DRAFT_1305190 [Flagelloscypha sp. PMI_526]